MAFKRQGKDLHSKIEVIKPIEDKKILASQEEKIICPHCKKVIGTKIGKLFQVLDKRLVSLKGTECPKCKNILIK